jgi:hypothetical protein
MTTLGGLLLECRACHVSHPKYDSDGHLSSDLELVLHKPYKS